MQGTGDQKWRSLLSFAAANNGELVTALDFDEDASYIATGNKSGQVNLYKKSENGTYDPAFRFKSHSPALDCLKSLEIEERINSIKFVRGRASGMFVLTTNDKVIKLWRVQKKRSHMSRRMNNSPIRMKEALLAKAGNSPLSSPGRSPSPGGTQTTPKPMALGKMAPPALSIGRNREEDQNTTAKKKETKDLKKRDAKMTATLKREYGAAHTYHVHSVSINSDCETFISLDSLRVNLWHLQRDAQRFPIIDIKPKDMGGLTEILTSGTFHPDQCNTLMYTTSRGRVCLHDLRSSAICKEPAKNFEITETAYPTKLFFSEVLTSISDAKFTKNGRYVLTRDYLSLKLWDVNMERAPVEVYPVQPSLEAHLSELYQNNALFDRFQCAPSPDGRSFATGSYSHRTVVQEMKAKPIALCAPSANAKPLTHVQVVKGVSEAFSKTNFAKKSLLCAWHPREQVIAVSGLTRLDVFEKVK